MTSVFLKFFTWIFMIIVAHRIFTAVIGVALGFIIYQAIVNPEMLGDLLARAIKWINSLDSRFLFSKGVETVAK